MERHGTPRGQTIILCAVAALLGCGLATLGNGNETAAIHAELVQANTQFSVDLYRALATDDSENLFFSPYSISTALAMTYAGAQGETEHQMARALHFTLSQEDLHPAFGALNGNLMEWTEGIDGVGLGIANALWGQDRHPFLAEFLDLIETSYDAPLEQADFAGDPEGARGKINDWIREKTEDLIPELFGPGSITPDTRLILANAIHFLGTWKHPFDEELTQNAPFHRLDGSEVSVPMMVADAVFGCVNGDDVLAVELPYAGDRLAMLILLPNEDAFSSFEAAFDAAQLDDIVAQLYPQHVWLAMPRFELSSEFSLASVLADLGMPDAFSSSADFSEMDGTHDLFISHVAHKAYVSVDEEGTEAAAATGVIMTLSLPPMIRVDRPFLFLIRDTETGVILFMGRVMDPSAG